MSTSKQLISKNDNALISGQLRGLLDQLEKNKAKSGSIPEVKELSKLDLKRRLAGILRTRDLERKNRKMREVLIDLINVENSIYLDLERREKEFENWDVTLDRMKEELIRVKQVIFESIKEFRVGLERQYKILEEQNREKLVGDVGDLKLTLLEIDAEIGRLGKEINRLNQEIKVRHEADIN